MNWKTACLSSVHRSAFRVHRFRHEDNRAHRRLKPARHAASLSVRAYNLGAPLDEAEWASVERDLCGSEIVFVIHVTDGENASRLMQSLKREGQSGRTVVVINCMPELMRQTRMGALSFGAKAEGVGGEGRARRLLKSVGSWMGEQARARRKGGGHGQ